MLWQSVASLAREDQWMHGAGCITSIRELIAEQGMEHMVSKLSSVRDAIMLLRERTEADD